MGGSFRLQGHLVEVIQVYIGGVISQSTFIGLTNLRMKLPIVSCLLGVVTGSDLLYIPSSVISTYGFL